MCYLVFELESYKNFLECSMRLGYFNNPNSKYTKEDFINSLIDFTAKGHGSRLGSRPGDQIKSLFTHIASNKPKSVSYTKYLLNIHGFKYCSNCNTVLNLSKFSSNKANWDLLSSVCRDCDAVRNKIYKSINKAKVKETHKIWYAENKHIRSANAAKRRAARKRASLLITSKEHKDLIKAIYREAYEQKMQVDHIVPLQGKYVCGLHVPWNLQVISKIDNISKNNYHESEEYWK